MPGVPAAGPPVLRRRDRTTAGEPRLAESRNVGPDVLLLVYRP